MLKKNKPWGSETIWTSNPFYVGKILFVKKGEATSLHTHQCKFEDILVISGSIDIEVDGKKWTMKEGDSVHIVPKTQHRFVAMEDVKLIEVASRQEESIIVNDRYGRK
jgi:mannose-6-phosphate isomerase-like protein (cupin superfamily)